MKKIGACILGIILLDLLVYNWQCPIKFLTGIPCLGCGMTRALKAACLGDFKTAFRYHPLFFMVPFMILGMIKQKALSKQQKIGIALVVVVSFVVVYIMRAFYLKDDVLLFEWKKGWLYRHLKH